MLRRSAPSRTRSATVARVSPPNRVGLGRRPKARPRHKSKNNVNAIKRMNSLQRSVAVDEFVDTKKRRENTETREKAFVVERKSFSNGIALTQRHLCGLSHITNKAPSETVDRVKNYFRSQTEGLLTRNCARV